MKKKRGGLEERGMSKNKGGGERRERRATNLGGISQGPFILKNLPNKSGEVGGGGFLFSNRGKFYNRKNEKIGRS